MIYFSIHKNQQTFITLRAEITIKHLLESNSISLMNLTFLHFKQKPHKPKSVTAQFHKPQLKQSLLFGASEEWEYAYIKMCSVYYLRCCTYLLPSLTVLHAMLIQNLEQLITVFSCRVRQGPVTIHVLII